MGDFSLPDSPNVVQTMIVREAEIHLTTRQHQK